LRLTGFREPGGHYQTFNRAKGERLMELMPVVLVVGDLQDDNSAASFARG
jgi:hypothetical protein